MWTQEHVMYGGTTRLTVANLLNWADFWNRGLHSRIAMLRHPYRFERSKAPYTYRICLFFWILYDIWYKKYNVHDASALDGKGLFGALYVRWALAGIFGAVLDDGQFWHCSSSWAKLEMMRLPVHSLKSVCSCTYYMVVNCTCTW